MEWSLLRLLVPGLVLAGLAAAVLTRVMPPLVGHGIALSIYWGWLAALLLLAANRSALRPLRRWGRGPVWLWIALAIPGAVLILWGGGQAVAAGVPVWLMAVMALGALTNGWLEEVFWRGAVLTRPQIRPAVAAWAAFVGYHVIWLASAGVMTWPEKAGLMIGAAMLGAVWMTARLRMGALYPGICSHVAVNLGTFWAVVATQV